MPRAGLTGQRSARVGMTTGGLRLDVRGPVESIYCISGRTRAVRTVQDPVRYACGVCTRCPCSLRVCGFGVFPWYKYAVSLTRDSDTDV